MGPLRWNRSGSNRSSQVSMLARLLNGGASQRRRTRRRPRSNSWGSQVSNHVAVAALVVGGIVGVVSVQDDDDGRLEREALEVAEGPQAGPPITSPWLEQDGRTQVFCYRGGAVARPVVHDDDQGFELGRDLRQYGGQRRLFVQGGNDDGGSHVEGE